MGVITIKHRETVLEINTNNFKYNIEQIKRYSHKEIMPVIKANGYGTYINKDLELINDFNIVAVAMVGEAVDLRNIGYKKDIFVLNQPYIEDIDDIIKYDIIVGLSSIEFINEIIKRNISIRCHLELETGMNRTGINIKDLPKYIELIKNSNIKVEGLYTHFSSADNDIEYTNKQYNLFKEGYDLLKEHFNFKYIHTSASNGLLNLKEDLTNIVRAGIIMYGYPSSNDTYTKIDLKPVAKLRSKINFIKEVEEGSSISYSRTFTSASKMTVATVGIGYADGIRRILSNKGKVIVNNHVCNIVGNICMDSFMIDVTNIQASVGDTVWIWDNETITLEDIAKSSNTINYEILCNISDRVPREFTK